MKLIPFVILGLMTSCIIMAPRRSADDMYSKVELSSQNYKIRFIEITADEIIKKGKDQIYLFASWCPHCLLHLRKVDKAKASETLYVSSNYDCKSMDRLFRNNVDTIYILSNSHYGSDESLKIKQFASEILGVESEIRGVPQQFVKGNCKYIRISK